MSIKKIFTCIMFLFCIIFILSCGTTSPIIASIPIYPIADEGTLIINEAASTGAYEFVELYNTLDYAVKLGKGWVLDDNGAEYNDGARVFNVPQDLIIPANGYLLLCPYITSDVNIVLNNVSIPNEAVLEKSFSLNNRDTIKLYYEEKLVDTISWKNDVNSIGRVAGEDSEISKLLIPTPGSMNSVEPIFSLPVQILINEVNTSGNDYIELINGGNEVFSFNDAVWTLEDIQKSVRIIIPASITIEPNGFLVVYPNKKPPQLSNAEDTYSMSSSERFGLGSNDTVILRRNGEIVDCYSWDKHVASAGRYPDGSEEWYTNLKQTIGYENKLN